MQNVLEYTGSKVDRQTIRKYEFHYANAKTQALKFDVLLVGPLQPERQASRINTPVKNRRLLSVQHMLSSSVHRLHWHEVLLLIRAVCLGCAAMSLTRLQAGCLLHAAAFC